MLSLAVFSGCTIKQEDTGKVNDTTFKKSNSGFEVYLVKEDQQILLDDITIDQLMLEDTPIISKSDIISYNWNLHTLKLKNNNKITRDLLQRSFVVMVDGERIYKGTFWSGVFSMVPPKVAVYLDNLVEDNDYIFLSLGSWAIGREIKPDAEQTLSDQRVKNVLERDGILYKPYKPTHFKRPDYINVSWHGSISEYAYIDWEKQDQLLKLLDERFTNSLEYINLELSYQDKVTLNNEEIIIRLVYKKQSTLDYNIGGEDRKLPCVVLLMSVTGKYNDLMFVVENYDDYFVNPVGTLKKLEDKDIEDIKSELPVNESTSVKEPQKMILGYYRGKPFEPIYYCLYELDIEEANKVREAASLGKALKSKTENNCQTLPLILDFGNNDDRWFYVLDDGQTVFTEGKYYNNPDLSKVILNIAREKCGFEIFDTSVFTGIVNVKYSFRTNTRTFECLTEDKDIITKIEKGLQKAQHSIGGGCPFSDGVLTLTFENGKTMDISMASDDCPLMFINGNYLVYSRELHDLFEKTFNNFPYVRN